MEQAVVVAVGIIAKDVHSLTQLYIRCPYCSKNNDNTFIKVIAYRKVVARGYTIIVGPDVSCLSNHTVSFRITRLVNASSIK